jgi:large subunit ribosomal protein L4
VPQVSVYNTSGQVVKTVDLDESVFGVEPNVSVMHQALLRQQANARLGTAASKTRGMVDGGSGKPWAQKGTGRARQGTSSSPIWKGGGVVFGPHPRKYTQGMPKQARRLALRSALASKVIDGHLILVDELKLAAPKTREMVAVLSALPVQASVLVVVPARVEEIQRACRNLPSVKVLEASLLNVADLLGFDYVLMPEATLEVISDTFGL